MVDNGYIKIYRGLLKWEWYDDVNTKVLFLHCLLRANWESTRWHGIGIEAGQFITSLATLAKETKLTVRQVRVALDHLNMTGEVTSKCHSKFRIITVNNWNQYQGYDKQSDKQATNKRQASDKQVTTDEEYKEEKEEKEIKNINIDIHKNIYSSNFELFWNEYPRKQDKGQAYKCYQARLRDGYTEDQLLIACKNYAAECKKEKREKKYIKVAGTFLSVNEPFVEYLKTDRNEGGGSSDNGNDILGGGITKDQREREEREERERYQRYFESDAFKHADDNLPFM